MTEDELERLTDLKEALIREYGHLPGFRGAGIGADGLRVYCADEATARQVPEVFEGEGVTGMVVGEIHAAGRSSVEAGNR